MKKRSGKSGKAGKAPRARRNSSRRSASLIPNAVFLVGFMGAGKTTVGQTLAARLNWLFEDLDHRIERREKRTVPEIFRELGEPAFREAEHAALRQVLEEMRGGVARVVALGGGAFAQKANVELLESAGVPTVFLDAPVDELWRRCCIQASQTGAGRPLLQSVEQFNKLYEARHQTYSRASHKVSTHERTVEDIAIEIAKKLKLRKMTVHIEEGDTE